MNYNYKINFAKHAKRFLIIAIVLMLESISSLIFKGLDFGIDFKGGTIVTIELNKKFTTDEIKNITDNMILKRRLHLPEIMQLKL